MKISNFALGHCLRGPWEYYIGCHRYRKNVRLDRRIWARLMPIYISTRERKETSLGRINLKSAWRWWISCNVQRVWDISNAINHLWREYSSELIGVCDRAGPTAFRWSASRFFAVIWLKLLQKIMYFLLCFVIVKIGCPTPMVFKLLLLSTSVQNRNP